jgi:Fe-S-cluster containining protein
MRFIPWRYLTDWRCTGCGECCRQYSVIINFYEWLKIVRNYGIENTASGLDKFFINRRSDGSCAFLKGLPPVQICGLQHMKPKACQLWPFKILREPKFGYQNEAMYPIGSSRVFVYADSMCNGLSFGTPTPEFAHSVVREFIEIAAGLRNIQFKTTSNIWLSQNWRR